MRVGGVTLALGPHEWSTMSKSALIGIVLAVMLCGPLQSPAAAQRNSGLSFACGDFDAVHLNLFFADISFASRPDEGWAYVNADRKIVEATGIAEKVRVAANDTPANHYSHDLDFNVRLDPGQDSLLSIQADDSLGIEWETGIAPTEKFGDGANPIFPKWAWPSEGDRVWVNGNWIHDCGHPENGLYRTEIHPARAVASMRDQAAPLDGTGLTPVPVTLTDLYITGRGGYAPNQLNCGLDIILGPYGATCGQATPPADDSYKTTPINDTDFTFNVCLPPRPSANAVPMTRVDIGPGNTVGIAPTLEFSAAAGYCLTDLASEFARRYDQGTMMRVTVPLRNTPTPPTAVYARRIYAGWLVPPDPVLPHRRVTIDRTDLRQDHDQDPGDGELTFWWVNVDRAERLWLRLSDFANGNMNDYDDDGGPGDGIMTFTNATFDFYLRHGQNFSVRSIGFEQDCYDLAKQLKVNDSGEVAFIPYFGDPRLSVGMYISCAVGAGAIEHGGGAGDALAKAEKTFSPDDLGARIVEAVTPLPGVIRPPYEVELTIDEVAPGLEDTSYLSIHTRCTSAGEVALVGQPLTCATRVDNAGTGLPRSVKITSSFSGPPLAIVDSATWSIRPPFGSGTYPCSAAGSEVHCSPDTVPVAAATPVNVTTIATPSAPGLLTGRAEVTTASTDPDLADNVATTDVEVFRSVTIDVSPGNPGNEINLRRGSVTVAIITTATFDATTVDPVSVCFGDADTPASRACAEQHGSGHIEDVNSDGQPDVLLHFAVGDTGIDLGDTAACLIARTRDGVGLYGCDAIVTRPLE